MLIVVKYRLIEITVSSVFQRMLVYSFIYAMFRSHVVKNYRKYDLKYKIVNNILRFSAVLVLSKLLTIFFLEYLLFCL